MTGSLYEKFQASGGVSTDTRTLKKGEMFFALRGPNFDANRFADEALEKGAAWAVIDSPENKKDDRYIVVDNTLTALQQLAIDHRLRFTIPVLGITGSNGKTTTKELTHAVLSKKFRVAATSGNLNNHIGVPLTLLSITHETEVAVIEMGANKPGDIKELCDMAHPNLGIITNIGKAHIEGFGSFDGVLKTKTELFDHLLKKGGNVFINSEDPILKNISKRFPDPLTYPSEEDFYHCSWLKADPFITYRGESGEEVRTQLIGTYNFFNLSAALCVGKYFGVDEKSAHEAIAGYVPSNMRSQVVNSGSNLLILDAYNANPVSMEAALKTLSLLPASHKVAILGDMFELGSISAEEHERIGRLTGDSGIHEVYFCGPAMAHAHTINPSSRYFPDKTALEKFLKENPIRNSVILVKASRGMQLETITSLLK